MKKLLTLVFLLVGLAGFTQTNSHTPRMTGHIYTRGLNFIPSNNDIQILLYEVDTFGIAKLVSSLNYNIGIQANQYVIDFINPPLNQVIVYVKLLPGSKLYGRFLSTFGLSSLSIANATKVIIPSAPLGTNPPPIVYDIHMIPDISWRSNSRHTE